jgi:hypothetical protein
LKHSQISKAEQIAPFGQLRLCCSIRLMINLGIKGRKNNEFTLGIDILLNMVEITLEKVTLMQDQQDFANPT